MKTTWKTWIYRDFYWVILKYAPTHNHPKQSTTTHNHPQPPITIHNHPQQPTTIQNYPQPSTTTHNHPQTPKRYPQPSTTTQKLLKKAKTCHKQLYYCTLDINIKANVDFDSNMKQCYIYLCVSLCVYTS